jgi:uncharacterized membrane protein YkvA (DUF1232 family)
MPMKINERLARIKIYLPALFLAIKHRNTPWLAKAIAIFALVYAISPIDLIPDVIPVIGYLDDLLILPVLIALCIKLIPKEVMEECLIQAKDIQLPKGKWYHALPILALWILLGLWILRLFQWI